MKLSFALIFASMASAAAMSVSHKNAKKVLSKARRLNQNEDEQQEDEFDYLTQYSLKMINCRSGETVVNGENGEYEYNAVVFRLCPLENGCDSDTSKGCSEGYGDFVVGLNTFVDAFFEDQRDNMNWDDNFRVDEYAECREYEVEEDEDNNNGDNNGNNQEVQYFIGPTCSADGSTVRLAVFDDEACTYESYTSFESISNGWTLPYSDGGLVSNQCLDCMAYNEDDGAYELREMCQELYENSGSKCETNMPYYSYYGQNVQGCEYVQSLMPVEARKKGNGGKVFGWFIFIAVVFGLAGYVMWWRKKKAATTNDGIMA